MRLNRHISHFKGAGGHLMVNTKTGTAPDIVEEWVLDLSETGIGAMNPTIFNDQTCAFLENVRARVSKLKGLL